MQKIQRISPFLWFDDQAETAANFYVDIFPNSHISQTSYYTGAGTEIHGRPEGSVMVVTFALDGCQFSALNGGPYFRFNEAISLLVNCADQAEIDYFWQRLGEGGDEAAQQCGWLKDKFGVSWQIVPHMLPDLLTGPDNEKSQRTMAAIMAMKKLDIDVLQRAHAGLDTF